MRESQTFFFFEFVDASVTIMADPVCCDCGVHYLRQVSSVASVAMMTAGAMNCVPKVCQGAKVVIGINATPSQVLSD